jgi:hypothetical protein
MFFVSLHLYLPVMVLLRVHGHLRNWSGDRFDETISENPNRLGFLSY